MRNSLFLLVIYICISGCASSGGDTLSIPVYGNWCGPGHPTPGTKAHIDSRDLLDLICMRHDACYLMNGYFDAACDYYFLTEAELILKYSTIIGGDGFPHLALSENQHTMLLTAMGAFSGLDILHNRVECQYNPSKARQNYYARELINSYPHSIQQSLVVFFDTIEKLTGAKFEILFNKDIGRNVAIDNNYFGLLQNKRLIAQSLAEAKLSMTLLEAPENESIHYIAESIDLGKRYDTTVTDIAISNSFDDYSFLQNMLNLWIIADNYKMTDAKCFKKQAPPIKPEILHDNKGRPNGVFIPLIVF